MIQEQIRIDIKKAMYDKDKEKLSLLRTIIGELNRKKGKEIDDNGVIQILKKMNENALLMKNQGEVDILSKYLPTVLDEKTTINIISEYIDNGNFGKNDMGSIMKYLKIKYGVSMDMKLSSMIVRQKL